MTRGSIREYAAALRARYATAGKAEKGRLLDGFCAATGYHRKAAVRRLRRAPAEQRRAGRRPPQDGRAVREALETVWEAADRACGKRLAPFLPDLVPLLERHGELALDPAVRVQLLGLSAATIDRLLRPARQRRGRRPTAQQPSSAGLRAQIPLRTFGDWAGTQPGALQADLVAHCGESTAGFYLTTLLAVDVATGWTEVEAAWGKGQERVGSGVYRIRERLPFPLRELHTDNGGEFINALLYPWCQREAIRLTRGRPYRKNDQAWVEQRNWQVVRRLVGYQRFGSRAAHAQLGRLYEAVRRSVNFFQPMRKLTDKTREGARVRKHFDQARTPYQRLLATEALSPTQRDGLERLSRRLNPVALRARIDADLAAITKADLEAWEAQTHRSQRVVREGVTIAQKVLAAMGYLQGEPPRRTGGADRRRASDGGEACNTGAVPGIIELHAARTTEGSVPVAVTPHRPGAGSRRSPTGGHPGPGNSRRSRPRRYPRPPSRWWRRLVWPAPARHPLRLCHSGCGRW
jgi:hypothetical protein